MLKVQTSNQFERDFKRMIKRGKDIQKIKAVMQKLTNEEMLDIKYRDHILKGSFKYHRECHIEPDWLLVYNINKNDKTIIFERTGSHSELFR